MARCLGYKQQKELEVKIVDVPAVFMDIISRDFAYDPVRLPLEQDPTQRLYNRKTLQTIWETEQRARNPFTRQWFDIKSAIPRRRLRRNMEHYINLHSFPADTIIPGYSKILAKGLMKRHLKELRESVGGRTITEDQWVKIWKKMNLVRLFCEFHSQNIISFISVNGFKYFRRLIAKALKENEVKEAALDVGKEIVRTIDVIINGLRSRGEDSNGIFGKLGENPKGKHVIFSLISILEHVYKNTGGYVKIQSFILRAFPTVCDEIAAKPDIVHGETKRAVLVGYRCVLNKFIVKPVRDISSEDLNHGIAILRRARDSLSPFSEVYSKALGNAVIICISREIGRSKAMKGFTGGRLLEAQVQAQHNSEALERGVRLIRDILMEESELATCILGRGVDIIKDLLHMFERFSEIENEDEDELGVRNFPVCNCEKSNELVQCVHYRIAQDGLEIREAISRKEGPLLDVEILLKFVSDRS